VCRNLSNSAHCLLCVPALATLQAPSGPPSDVSSQLLRMCDMADASEGLSDEAVIESLRAGRGEPSGSPGEHRLSGLGFEAEMVSAHVRPLCGCFTGFGSRGGGRVGDM